MSRLKKFFTSPIREQVQFVLAGVLLVSLPTVLTIGTFSRVRSALISVSDAISSLMRGSQSAARVIHVVEATDDHVPGHRTCLVRSLTAETLLRTSGHSPEHKIGVNKTSNGIEAHSWLESDGEILIGDVDDLEKYDPFPSLDMAEGLRGH